MTKILNFALKIKEGGREGGTCEVLRPCHPPKIWNVHKVRIFGSPCCVPRLRRKQPIECLKKFCVRILKGMSKGSRACVNFEGKIRTQNFLKVNSELYTTACPLK